MYLWRLIWHVIQTHGLNGIVGRDSRELCQLNPFVVIQQCCTQCPKWWNGNSPCIQWWYFHKCEHSHPWYMYNVMMSSEGYRTMPSTMMNLPLEIAVELKWSSSFSPLRFVQSDLKESTKINKSSIFSVRYIKIVLWAKKKLHFAASFSVIWKVIQFIFIAQRR